MTRVFEKRLALIESADRDVIAGGRKGVEKEALRVSDSGYLALTPHPVGLGSALTNRYITTDFSEALLEFVTPAYASSWEALQVICDIHQFTHGKLGEELLWPASMPCRVPEGSEIPLAKYGTSNVGRMKTIYRRGLGHRYGRPMQTIAGVHFNYSLPESFWPAYQALAGDSGNLDAFRSDHYLGLVRNFRRFGWLVLYLFGASPALCRSFEAARPDMPVLHGDTFYEPYATSLRMSDLGYSNKTQAGIKLSLNSLDEYISALSSAIRTPEPQYEAIGVKVDGEYRQLNANTLQIENEYYSSVRPKRVAHSGERPTAALRRGGIEYVEIRSLDISLYDPAGINQNTMRFIEAFLIYCLLEESPPLDDEDLQRSASNQALTAKEGRRPGLELRRSTGTLSLRDWALSMLDDIARIARLIDAGEDGNGDYANAVAEMRKLVDDPGLTPSALLLADMNDRKIGYFDYVLEISRQHRDYFDALRPLPRERLEDFETEAEESLARQAEIEAQDTQSLDAYLAEYFAREA